MSCTVLSRSRGSVVRCNGCGVTSSTGQVEARVHREYLRTTGWSRGICAGTKTQVSTKRHDLCPSCKDKDRAEFARRKAKRADQVAARDAARKDGRKARTFAVHWVGGVRHKGGVLAPGFPCCCSGRRCERLAAHPERMTDDAGAVTCKSCIAVMRRSETTPIGTVAA